MGIEHQIIPYNYFSGERTDKVLTDFEPHELIRAKNCRLSRKGQVGTRYGWQKYNQTRLAGNGPVLGLFDFHYSSTGQKFIVCEDDKIYIDDGTVRTQIQAGQDTAAYYSFVSYDDFCWMVNGVDTMLKYDGTTVTNASIAPPISHPTWAGPPSGSGNWYAYLVTYTSADGQESAPFSLATSLTVEPANPIDALNSLTINNVPLSPDAQVTGRNIYRSSVQASAAAARVDVYDAQLVGTLADNTTTNFTDTIEDTNRGALINLDHDPAPLMDKIVVHQNRGFGFHGTTLYFSILFNLWYWPQGIADQSIDADIFTIEVGADDGYDITNILPYRNELLIFKKNAIYVLSGFDETDFTLSKLEVEHHVGCVGKRAAVVSGNWCYFLDVNGIYRTDGQIVDYIGLPEEAFFDPDNPNVTEKVNRAYMDDAVMIEYNRKPNNNIICMLPSWVTEYNDVALVFDHKLSNWVHDMGYRGQSMTVRRFNNRDYLMRGDDVGWIAIDDSLEGDGALISSISTGAASFSNYATGPGSGTDTLEDTTLAMGIDAYVGYILFIKSGTGAGESKTILSNTATEFTVDSDWDDAPDITTFYYVINPTTGNTINTLNDNTLAMTVNAYVGMYLKIVDGTNEGDIKRIASNTATQFTIEGNWGAIISSTATAGGASTMTDATLSMVVDQFDGYYIKILAGTGAGQTREIDSNTADTFTVTVAWGIVPDATSQYIVTDNVASVPDATSEYVVGGIEYDVQHLWEDYGNPSLSKRLNWIRPRLDTLGNYTSRVFFYWDFQIEASESEVIVTTARTLWDVSLWDVGLWDDVYMVQDAIAPPGGHIHRWSSVRFFHDRPAQPIKLNGYDRIFQVKRIRLRDIVST